ncbi:MAG TPA: hypothetical protein VFW60_03755 [Rhodanobacteraceae bacterium]|nr:hypothetical protein [Rhodanobacteraceae bacterium]
MQFVVRHNRQRQFDLPHSRAGMAVLHALRQQQPLGAPAALPNLDIQPIGADFGQRTKTAHPQYWFTRDLQYGYPQAFPGQQHQAAFALARVGKLRPSRNRRVSDQCMTGVFVQYVRATNAHDTFIHKSFFPKP